MSDQQDLKTMQYIGGLFFRRLNDDLSESDQIALDEWINQQDPASQRFFEEMTDWEQIQAALQSLYLYDTESALADVQKKIHLESVLAISTSEEPETLSVEPIVPENRRYRRYRYILAAIFFTLLIGVSVVVTLTKRKSDIASLPVAQRFKNDVSPGGEKAILRLADGSQIALDSASNGELARQGATRVMKLTNGQVTYNAHPSSGSSSVSYNTISTPRGGQYQVVLPDGSKVWLNAASSLKFPTVFAGEERLVELTGEAFFQVAKNAAKPFKVAVTPVSGGGGGDPMIIEVLGTEFNVMAYSDEDDRRTTLIDGAVKVAVNNEQVVLRPGQQGRVMNSTSSLNVVSNVNTDKVMAWKTGYFYFQNEDIQSVMRVISRWYDVSIQYEGKITEDKFSGTMRMNNNISELLTLLEMGSVHYRIEGRKIIVLP